MEMINWKNEVIVEGYVKQTNWTGGEKGCGGKLRWVLGGAKGMQLMDFFDLAMHGLPWVMLLVSLGKLGMAVSKSKAKPA